MPPVLLSGRFPSVSVPQGVSWWIWVGRLVLPVSPAPLVPAEAAVSPRRRAPRGCLAPGSLGPRTPAVAAPWWPSLRGRRGPLEAAPHCRRAPLGCPVPPVVHSWRRAVPPECLLPGPLVPWEVLTSPWWRGPRDRLLPRRQGPSKAVRLWHHGSGLPVLGRRVPLKALEAPWRRTPLVPLPPGRLVPWRAAVLSWWRAPSGFVLRGRRVPLKVLVSPWWQPPLDCLAPGRLGVLQAAVAAS
jgi:hypothetical protein